MNTFWERYRIDLKLPLLFALFAPFLALGLETSPSPTSNKPGKIALIQYTADAHFGAYGIDYAGLQKSQGINLQNMTSLFHEAVYRRNANIVVFPEGASLGYERHPSLNVSDFNRIVAWCAPEKMADVDKFRKDVVCVDPTPFAEAIPDGPTTRYWAEKAKAAGVYVMVPMIEKVLTPEGKVRFANTAIVLGPQGYVTKHRKTSRWSNEEFLDTVVGDETTLLQTEYGLFGIAICNGIFNKTITNAYSEAKIDALIFMADWVEEMYAGYKGDSDTNSFTFLSTWKELNIFSADDARSAPGAEDRGLNGSARTGYFPKDKSLGEIRMPENSGRDGFLLMDFHFDSSVPVSQQVLLSSRVMVDGRMRIVEEHNQIPGLFEQEKKECKSVLGI